MCNGHMKQHCVTVEAIFGKGHYGSCFFPQVVDLDASTKSLSQSVANVPQLVLVQSLPQQVKDLSKVDELVLSSDVETP